MTETKLQTRTVVGAPRPRAFGVRIGAIAVSLLVLAIVAAASIALGSRPVALTTVITILSGGDADPADVAAVIGLRIPRTVVGIGTGIALGLAGGVIQAVTRNPLADPGVLGVNSGAAFAVAIGIAAFGVTSPSGWIWLAFLGAFIATVAVYLIGSGTRGGANPARLVLAGMAMGAVLAGVIAGLRLADPKTFAALQVWEAGTLQGRGWDVAVPTLPFIAAGILLTFALSPSLNMIALGDDLATALGAHVIRTRVLSVVAITVLAGGATAMAGPIAFVGLMVPHVARWIVGPDQRWILPLTAVLAPVLLLAADIVARVILWPGEVPVGVVTAFLGAPVLIALVRRRNVSAL